MPFQLTPPQATAEVFLVSPIHNKNISKKSMVKNTTIFALPLLFVWKSQIFNH